VDHSFDLVLFGGRGDLSMRKLLPSLYRACDEGALLEGTRLFPTVRSEEERDSYIEWAQESLKRFLNTHEYNEECWSRLKEMLNPVWLDIGDTDSRWKNLATTLKQTSHPVVYYLAVPPAVFEPACRAVHEMGLVDSDARIVLEKPIGYDRESANEINSKIAEYFAEEQIYRIDHYLGKETVQNLLALRMSNVLFEQLWDAQTIDHIQISICETVGLEGRAGFYDKVGAIRDMIQNHALQLLCFVAMEKPGKFQGDQIRAEKIKVLDALRLIEGEDVDKYVVRGQYSAGQNDGQLVAGYVEELGDPSSLTETYVAIKAYIDNWRWSGVPFYLRTGKRMNNRYAEIVIQYKPVSHRAFDESAGEFPANRLTIRLQPDEAIELQLNGKKLDQLNFELAPMTLNLSLADQYKHFQSDAYKRLILDAAANNSSLFIHRDEVDLAWRWIDPIIKQWNETAKKPDLYRSGGHGPFRANDLFERPDQQWSDPEL